MTNTFEQLKEYMDKVMAFQAALTLFEWDAETLAPDESMNYTAKTIGILSNEYFTNLINEKVKALLVKLSEEDLNVNEKAIVKQMKKSYEEMELIPPKEYQALKELTAKASGIWAKAKKNQNFGEYAPILDEIITYQKKFAGYRVKANENPYDILLNDFEEGFNTENKQKEFCNYLSEYVGFDKSKGVIAESAHPFTMNIHNHDVRITNHFHRNNLESAIFSIIHESGHGIYEMNIDDEITQTPVGGGTSMGMHESQSRFFENIIGRSESFWIPIYEKLKGTFPEQLKDVTLDHFIKGINKSQPSLIRTEAD
ncbi:MAG: ypwA, partial [Anaerocolumna sp.]|nr:ypwA [Anaerocolumna sp.]